MSTTTEFIKEHFVPFRQKVIETLQEKYPHILPVIDKLLSGKKNSIGLQLTENGSIIGEFTFHLNGINIEEVETDTLSPTFHHPFLGIIKPYVVVEKQLLEMAIKDQGFFQDPLPTLGKHLPNLAFKFQS